MKRNKRDITRARKLATLQFIALALCLACAGCTRAELTFNAVGYNKALGAAGDKQVFLNAVRASKGFPLHFSAIGELDGRSMLKSASLSASLPFGRNTMSPFVYTPDVEFRGPIDTLKITPLNQGEFYQAIVKPAEIKYAETFYSSEEWDREIVLTLFLSELRIDDYDYGNIDYNYVNMCERGKSPTPLSAYDLSLCRQIKRSFEECGSPQPRAGIYTFKNVTARRCEFLAFQAIVRALLLMDMTIVPQFKVTEDEKGNRKFERENLRFYFKMMNENGHREQRVLQSTGNEGTSINFRSPVDMIRYVGGLISVQLRDSDHYRPAFVSSDGTIVPMFWVEHGPGVTGPQALSVNFRGELFTIPDVGYDSRERHQSLQMLTIINQLLATGKNLETLQGNTLLLTSGR